MSFFFFGTLRDPDVLERVLERPLARDEHCRAALDDHRVVRAAAAPWPVLVAAPGSRVPGRLLLRPSERDRRRILWFEEDEYAERWCEVRLEDGRPAPARVFFALDALGTSDVPWDYARWRIEEKADYLRRCAAWLREAPP